MSQDTERPSDERVARAIALAEPGEAEWHEANVMAALAREVQASRKLVADLRAMHRLVTTTKRGAYNEPYDDTRCRACGWQYSDASDRCPTIRMIDEAGL